MLTRLKKSCTWPGSHKSPVLASGKDIISKRTVSETSPVSSKHRVTKEAKVILKGRVLTGTPDSITCDGTVYDKIFLEQTMKKQAQRKRVVGQSPWPFGFDNHGYLYKGARFPASKDKSIEIEIIYSSAKRHQLIWKAASFYHTGYHLPEDNLKVKKCVSIVIVLMNVRSPALLKLQRIGTSLTASTSPMAHPVLVQ